MQFMVLGYDGKDSKALERRLAARDTHLALAEKLYKTGAWLYAAAILDDEGKMTGSMIICNFDSKEEMYKEWLDKEAYIQNDVWQKIEIHRAQVAPFCLPGQ